MREFAGKGRLGKLDPGGKLVYTAFLIFMVAGLVSAALLHGDGMGVSKAAEYWRGDESQMLYPKSYRQILELTHFHLFTEPVCFLVVAHLYNLGTQKLLIRTIITTMTILAIAAQIALPWLTVYGSATFGILMLPVHTSLLLGVLWMAGWSLWELWAPG
jgi:hypothetical protein